MEQITQAEALKKGLDRYFTGKPCKREHVSERYARSGMCIACARERQSHKQAGVRSLVWEKKRWALLVLRRSAVR